MGGAGDTGRADAAGRRGAGMNPDPVDGVTIVGEIIFYFGGNPRLEDLPYMASTTHCANEEIFPLLERRERARVRRERQCR